MHGSKPGWHCDCSEDISVGCGALIAVVCDWHCGQGHGCPLMRQSKIFGPSEPAGDIVTMVGSVQLSKHNLLLGDRFIEDGA
jgi:hypothetical protein